LLTVFMWGSAADTGSSVPTLRSAAILAKDRQPRHRDILDSRAAAAYDPASN